MLEKRKIIAYQEMGVSRRKIATRLKRSHTAVNTFLKNYRQTGKVERKKRVVFWNKTNPKVDKKIVKN